MKNKLFIFWLIITIGILYAGPYVAYQVKLFEVWYGFPLFITWDISLVLSLWKTFKNHKQL